MTLAARFLMPGALTVALLAGTASPARADLITIGLSTGGAPAAVAAGPGTAFFSGSLGAFSTVQVLGTGVPLLVPPALLDSNTLDASTVGPGTLKVFVTEQNVTSPLGSVDFLSSFTSNQLTAGWTVTEQTFLDTGNGLFALTTPLDSHTFTAIAINVQLSNIILGLIGPYSLTEVYTIIATGSGNTNDTIDLSATPVPEPASLLLLGTGLLGVVRSVRRRRSI